MKTIFSLFILVTAASAGVLPLSFEWEGRITNGETAVRGQFPYQVALNISIGANKYVFCGGTLISPLWILTAAHCAKIASSLTVILGATNVKNQTEEGVQLIDVSRANIFVHENYSSTKVVNDIALLKLPAPIKQTNFIQIAELPKRNGNYSTYEGELAYASGWGKDRDNSTSVSPILRYIIVPVLKNFYCKFYYLNMINNDMICTKPLKKKSTCQGDSGGPLVHKNNGRNVVIGITSFGIAFGCEKGWPPVYTRVTSYLNWIEKTTSIIAFNKVNSNN